MASGRPSCPIAVVTVAADSRSSAMTRALKTARGECLGTSTRYEFSRDGRMYSHGAAPGAVSTRRCRPGQSAAVTTVRGPRCGRPRGLAAMAPPDAVIALTPVARSRRQQTASLYANVEQLGGLLRLLVLVFPGEVSHAVGGLTATTRWSRGDRADRSSLLIFMYAFPENSPTRRGSVTPGAVLNCRHPD